MSLADRIPLDISSLPSWPPLAPWILLGVAVFFAVLCWRLVGTVRRQRAALRSAESHAHGRSVKRGVLGEALAPLLDSFPVDVEKSGTTTLFVGQPVDYLHFDPEEGVTFLEIKSGGSRLSAKQERLRTLIEAGQVRWETLYLDKALDRHDVEHPDPLDSKDDR